MGKNSHAPRGGLPSKKALPRTDEDDSFIVFSDAKHDPNKGQGSGSLQPESGDKRRANGGKVDLTTEDGPKKPTTRQLIGGASWTGKLPMNLLAEHCQKQKWEKPEYTMNKLPDGFYSHTLLRSRDVKTQELIGLPPTRLPATHKHLAAQPSAAEARHFAAAYALFRVCSMRNYHLMMPPMYRDLWKGDFQDLKKEDVTAGKGWMYEADPFQAQKEREEAQIQMAKKRLMKDKEQATKQSQPGNIPISSGTDMMKGWLKAPKVEMGKRTRREVESLLRSQAVWNPHQVQLSSSSRLKIIEELGTLGFRKSHIEEAANICKDKEEVLEWLLIHVPEDDLPGWSLPEGYVAGVSMASGNLKREGAIKRLAASGYASEFCEAVYDSCDGDERKTAEKLQQSLLACSEGVDEVLSRLDGSQVDSSNSWDEEQTVLASIYEGKYEKLDRDHCQVNLDIGDSSQTAIVNFCKPSGCYPYALPVIFLMASLPSYIRLSIMRQALAHAANEFLGEQMIFNIVDWLEREIPSIIANPGKLADISSVSNSDASTDPVPPVLHPYTRRKRQPRPVKWHPGTEGSLRLLAQWETRQSSTAQQRMSKVRQSLPAWKLQEAIVQAVNTYQVVIISGETGSGKSTQAVQFILDDLLQRQLGEAVNIICTQPRRISALGLADRVSDERCSVVGQEIGYSIRGESKQAVGVTKVTFVTTGVLLRRLQTSGGSTDDVVAALADISHVVVDEVHERTLDTDFLLALLRDVLRKRKDLKVILMSATLDAEVFETYFGGEGIVGKVEIEGRTFPVDDYYIDDVVRMTGFGADRQTFERAEEELEEENAVAGMLKSIGMGINYDLVAALVRELNRELGTQDGGILIFLPGTMEISRTLDALRTIPSLHALPLHASLMTVEQRRVFPPAPSGKRKVIVSTNIAETSITIEDIVAVIDTGRVKETRYDAQNNMVKLEEVWASRAAGKQRRGRAGRVQAGKCFKLYTQNAEAKMAERPDPEIRRVPLEQLCLSVKAMGVPDVASFLGSTLTPPESLAVDGALELLRRMGAVEGDILTALGRHMSMIPADLRCAKLMVYGALFGCLEASVTIAAILTSRSPFVSPRDKRDESKAARASFAENQGDVVADLRAYEAWSTMRHRLPFRETRSWCEQNFLSSQTLNDISATRNQYLSSLREIGFLPFTYQPPSSPPPSTNDPISPPQHTHYNRNASSTPLLHALLLSALHPQTLRISLPTQKYTPTLSGTLALSPAPREIKFYTPASDRAFVHPSSTLFSSQSFGQAHFLSYFNRVATSKVFVRELSPCGCYGMLLFGGGIELDTLGRGLLVDGWVRMRGWARIGVLVGRLRGVLDGVLARWVEEPEGKGGVLEERVVDVVRRLVELEGMDR